MRGLILGAALIALPAAARAETFAFETSAAAARTAVLPAQADGRPGGSMVETSATLTTGEGPAALRARGACESWIPPAGAPFSAEGVCRLSDGAGGVYVVGYSCDAGGASCRAEVAAAGGRFAGRRGRLAYRASSEVKAEGLWDVPAAVAQGAGMKDPGRWAVDGDEASH